MREARKFPSFQIILQWHLHLRACLANKNFGCGVKIRESRFLQEFVKMLYNIWVEVENFKTSRELVQKSAEVRRDRYDVIEFFIFILMIIVFLLFFKK